MADNVTVKFNLDGTKQVVKNIKNIDKILDAGSQGIVRTGILENWLAGKGGNGKQMPALSPKYADRKSEGKVKVGGSNRGGEPIRNLLLTGSMQRAFQVLKEAPRRFKLAFVSSVENTKAIGNHKYSKDNMMKVSTKIRKKFTAFVNKQIFRNAR